jgi:polysaccharide chain length determinant protein (PEP-CTERM system associated)
MPEELFEEASTEAFDWRHYLGLIRRHAWYFLLALFAGWLTVWGVSWLLPSVYRSGTLILVEQPSVPQQFVVSNVAGNLQERLQTITQQILSRTRLLGIIDNLNLYPEERKRLTQDDLVERMRKDIDIALMLDKENALTSFNIYYSSKTPSTAQRVTSELSNLFISENLEARQQQSQNTTEFLASRLEEARKALSEQEEKVREFKDKHLGELPGQLQSNLQILVGMQAQMQAEEDNLNRAKQQNVYLESLVSQYRTVQRSAKTGEGMPIGLPALDQELERLRAQLADISSHYTDRHPDVRKLKEQIAKTERMKQQLDLDLASKAPDSQADNSGTAPKNYADVRDMSPLLELQSQLKANQIEITNRQRAIQELQAKIGEYQARLNQAPVREQQFTDLSRGYDQSRANYDSLLKKKNDSELATSLELRQQGEHFRVVDPPSLPVKPYSPNRPKLSAIGLVVGIILGAALTAGRELMDDRIYSDREFKKFAPVTVIAEIPDIAIPGEERTRQWKVRLLWVTAGLIFVSILAGSALSYLRG